ncbi:MAG: DUF805 domain-containing protein [Pseudooceanicola sp.]|nr:DUF805 domain-containing protein [Pseudooceanicola sp.]
MRKFIEYDGRASRSEFWYFMLFLALVQTVGVNVANWANGHVSLHFVLNLNIGPSESWWTNLFTILFTLPFLAVLSRRCQDGGTAGSRILVALFATLAVATVVLKISPTQDTYLYAIRAALLTLALLFLWATVRKSQPGPNRYGPNPNEVTP